MAAPRVLVLSGYGLNCEAETLFAFEQAGAVGDIVHINDLIDRPEQIDDYQIMALPGGFSFGDDTGSGKAFANRMRHHLGDRVHQFAALDNLVIGICNGFQIISQLGLVPAIDDKYGKQSVALTNNDSARYLDRWVDLKVENDSPWLAGIGQLSMPIAHGEGRLYADEAVLGEMRAKGLVALSYTKGEISSYLDLPANPNGSIEDIAGVTNQSGRILGLMPHPERAIAFTHQPHWPTLANDLRRKNKPLPTGGPGLQIFKNAINYFE